MAKASKKRKKSSPADQDAPNGPISEVMKKEDSTSDMENLKPNVKHFTVPMEQKDISCRLYGAQDVQPALIFTHGAGGGLDNPATESFSEGFATTNLTVVGFQGTMNLKNRTKGFVSVLNHIRKQHSDPGSALALGGRSMGARAAVLAAQESIDITALVLVSYPLKNAKGEVRDQILLDIPKEQRVLFVSGDNDNMCDLEQLAAVRKMMKAKTWLVTAVGADHGMSLKQKDGIEPLRRKTGEIASQWIKGQDSISGDISLSWDQTDGAAVVVDELSPAKGRSKLPKLKGKCASPTASPPAKKRRRRTEPD